MTPEEKAAENEKRAESNKAHYNKRKANEMTPEEKAAENEKRAESNKAHYNKR